MSSLSHTHTHTSSYRTACQSAEGRLKTVDVYLTFRQSSVTSDPLGECPPCFCSPSHRHLGTIYPTLYSLPPPSPILTPTLLSTRLGMLGSSLAALCSMAKAWNLRKSTFVSLRSSCPILNGSQSPLSPLSLKESLKKRSPVLAQYSISGYARWQFHIGGNEIAHFNELS